jgi:hypothetical protein
VAYPLANTSSENKMVKDGPFIDIYFLHFGMLVMIIKMFMLIVFHSWSPWATVAKIGLQERKEKYIPEPTKSQIGGEKGRTTVSSDSAFCFSF